MSMQLRVEFPWIYYYYSSSIKYQDFFLKLSIEKNQNQNRRRRRRRMTRCIINLAILKVYFAYRLHTSADQQPPPESSTTKSAAAVAAAARDTLLAFCECCLRAKAEHRAAFDSFLDKVSPVRRCSKCTQRSAGARRAGVRGRARQLHEHETDKFYRQIFQIFLF
jgi:hypothetical protein